MRMFDRLSRLARRLLPLPLPVGITKYRGVRIVHPPGHNLMWSVRQGEEIELPEWQLLQSWAHQPFHALDIGANVGLHALPLAALNPDGKVYAFEANPVSFTYLQLGIMVNGFAHRLELINGAVCEHVGVEDFTAFSPYGSTADGLQDTGRGWMEKHTLTVLAVTLDAWMQRCQPERIDFIKLDIEGGELLALSGAQNLLKKYRPKILMECYSVNLAAYGKTVYHVYEFAAHARYVVCDLDLHPIPRHHLEQDNSANPWLYNIVLLPQP